jgi:tetratricopeptide (TPR) repeat protein
LEDALAIVRDIGDRRSEGIWLGSLGEVACEIGDYQVARRRFEAALAIARELGDRRSQRDWLGDLGGIECKLGRHTEAGAHYRHALVVARELGRPDDLLLEACAELLVALGRFEDATELVGVADAISAQARRCPSLSERSRHDTSLATCRSQLSEQAFELAYERGRASDWACAAARAMELLED